MLEQLFGSRTRWKLLRIFLSHPDEKYFVRELARTSHETLNSVRRELANLEDQGIVKVIDCDDDSAVKHSKKVSRSESSKKYYTANKDFLLFHELKSLIMKSWLLVERQLVKRITDLGNINFMVLGGKFVGDTESEVDVFIVGSVNRDKLGKLMGVFEKNLGEEINYTIMSKKEFDYRKAVTDKFLYRILENEHITVVSDDA